MTTVQTSNEDFENARKQIRGIVGEIAQLAKSDLGPEEFHAALLTRVVAALQATGGAIWILGEGKRPQLSYQMNISPSLLDPESDDATRHARLLDMIVNSNQPQLVPPLSGNEQGGNPTRNLLVVAPLGHDKAVEGLIEIFQRPNTQPNAQKGYLKFLLQMTELASEWFKNRRLRHFSDRHSLWAQADQFARLVHDSLDFRETCYTIVNEGRRLIGCDRVAICVDRGGKSYVEAISGQDTLDNRSNVVYHLNQLATRVVASGETLWYHGSTEDMPPQIESALESYVDESYTKSMVILPIRKPNPGDDQILNPGEAPELAKRQIIGAMIVEQLESDLPKELLEPRIDLVYEHAARALANTLDHHSLFLMPVWKTIGKSRVIMQGRNLPKTLTISAAVLAVLGAMFLVPVDFTMKSKGALQPIDKRDVYASVPGLVGDVLKDDGDSVEAGDVLIQLESNDLSQQLSDIAGRLENAVVKEKSLLVQKQNKKLSELERIQVEVQIPEVQQQIISLTEQLALVKEKIEKLTVRSPIKGKVITWDAKENLQNRPVETGQILMSVANEESKWRLELYMPERRVGHLRKAYKTANGKPIDVRFILMTDPGNELTGKVEEIENSTFVHDEEGPCVRVKVALDQQPVNPRPNASLTAKAIVGRTSLGNSWFHEAWEYLQANWLFW